jgi:hypothetical protein
VRLEERKREGFIRWLEHRIAGPATPRSQRPRGYRGWAPAPARHIFVTG